MTRGQERSLAGGAGRRLSGFAPSPQGSGPFGTLIIGPQQDVNLDPERFGQAVEDIEGGIYDPTLDARQVGGGNTSIVRERLLRQSTQTAQVPDIPCKARRSIHAPRQAIVLAQSRTYAL